MEQEKDNVSKASINNSKKLLIDSTKQNTLDISSLLLVVPEAYRNTVGNLFQEPTNPVLNWIFHQIGSVFEIGLGFLILRLVFYFTDIALIKFTKKSVPKGISFWVSLLGSAIYISLLELNIISLWPFYPAQTYLNSVPDFADLFGIWLFPTAAIIWRYGIPQLLKLYSKIVTGSIQFKPNKVNDVSFRERISMSTDRELEYYLGKTHLNAEDLNNKVIVNLGAGGTDIERDIQNYNKDNDKQIKPSQVVNIDLKYPQKYEQGMPNDAVKANILSLPLSNGVADIIFSAWSLSVWVPREKQAQGYLETTRLLKDGGVAYIFPLGGRSLNVKEVSSVIKDKFINTEVSYDKKSEVLTIRKLRS